MPLNLARLINIRYGEHIKSIGFQIKADLLRKSRKRIVAVKERCVKPLYQHHRMGKWKGTNNRIKLIKRLRIFDHKKHPIKVRFLCPTFMG